MSRVVEVIAHDIRSTQNVGSLFRTADSLGVAKLWLTGYTPRPDHAGVQKTGLGAEKSVPYECQLDVVEVIERLRSDGYRIVGLEVDERAVSLSDYAPPEKVALLLGNEVLGIPPSLRRLCDDLVQIPQRGMKESLNVGVAAGIAAFWLMK